MVTRLASTNIRVSDLMALVRTGRMPLHTDDRLYRQSASPGAATSQGGGAHVCGFQNHSQSTNNLTHGGSKSSSTRPLRARRMSHPNRPMGALARKLMFRPT